MTEYERREQELLEFANQCKAAGLRVFFSNWKHSKGRRKYFHASDGVGIAYIENSDVNFGYFTLGITYKPSRNFGTGCNLRDWKEWRNPSVEDVKFAVAMREAPYWLVERYKEQPTFYKDVPTFYKDVDEWLEEARKHCEIVEL